MNTLSTKTHTARKEHTCDLCCNKIKVGQRYEAQANVHLGDFYTFKSHNDCIKLAKTLDMWSDVDEEGLTAETYHDLVVEEYYRLCVQNNLDSKLDNDWNIVHEFVIKYRLGVNTLMEKL